MDKALYRLVYISHNEIVGDDAMIRREIEQILASAREKTHKRTSRAHLCSMPVASRRY